MNPAASVPHSGIMKKIRPKRRAVNGEHHESSEGDWRDDPGNGSRALDELSQEEILRALARLDERLRADPEDTAGRAGSGRMPLGRPTERRTARSRPAPFLRAVPRFP